MGERVTGKVKWFSDQRGYGFITSDDGGGGEDLFVHQSSIRTGGFRSVGEGDSVEVLVDSDDGRTRAVDVTGPDGAAVQSGSRSYGGGGHEGEKQTVLREESSSRRSTGSSDPEMHGSPEEAEGERNAAALRSERRERRSTGRRHGYLGDGDGRRKRRCSMRRDEKNSKQQGEGKRQGRKGWAQEQNEPRPKERIGCGLRAQANALQAGPTLGAAQQRLGDLNLSDAQVRRLMSMLDTNDVDTDRLKDNGLNFVDVTSDRISDTGASRHMTGENGYLLYVFGAYS